MGERFGFVGDYLFEAFERGALIVNYLGHGNENGITGERIFENTDAQAVNNPFKYTC